MNHLEFASIESEVLHESKWERWADSVEDICGHSVDGDQYDDEPG